MRSKTSFFLLLQLLPACSNAPGDPSREPPGQPGSGDSSSSDADSNDTADDSADLDDGSSDEGVGESTDGAIEDMPCGDLCLAKAPSGWHGPAAVIRSSAADEPPACGASHPTELATLVSDLVAPAAVCDCNCGDATDVACDTATARLYASPDCTNLVESFEIEMSCTNLPTGTGHWSVEFMATGGECEPLPSFTVPDLDFTRWTLCGAEPLAGECEFGEACTAAPGPEFETSQCIWMAGDVACPGSGYTDRTLVHGDLQDDRSCGECSCAAPTGTCDDGIVGMSLVSSCSGSGISLWEAPPGDCFGEIPVESAEILEPATPFASCEPTMPVGLGGASLEQPHTLCCEPR